MKNHSEMQREVCNQAKSCLNSLFLLLLVYLELIYVLDKASFFLDGYQWIIMVGRSVML